MLTRPEGLSPQLEGPEATSAPTLLEVRDLKVHFALRGGFFQRLRDLPPWQQERFMANNPRFRQLPPQRQQMIRERLRKWNAMSPEEKQRFRQREEIFQSLSPAQRQEARKIFPQWQALPPGRRQAVLQAFRRLRDLPPQQRERFLASPGVRERFSPHEQNILRGLSRLLPGARPAPPGESDE